MLARFAARRLLDTHAADILQLIQDGTVSTNMYFRRLHSFALTLGWLQWPILNFRQWPSRIYKQKRGITWEEHRMLVDTEKNEERRAFLELAWHVGAAQIDLVSLTAENIDRSTKTITYFRCKTGNGQRNNGFVISGLVLASASPSPAHRARQSCLATSTRMVITGLKRIPSID